MKRCAIYTRKSTEEGLEQDFNSLDAQREACEAYIKSQVHEGWKTVSARYDDGGYSGGGMNRPGLASLLEAVERNQIDIIIVYKVDRLTRSLSDFARIVDRLDASGVSFVSVTQQFNTTTSMGRLTLNVLLSFAQFEREVTAERIRDKIAASKKKGMWMGGPVPLGYDVVDRALVVNQAEAHTVRQIFEMYLELGSVRLLKRACDDRGIRSKIRTSRSGVVTGGAPLRRGNLYQMLSNPIYVGRIAYQGETYPGQHDGIIPEELWETVQSKLKANAVSRRIGTNAASPSLLKGIVFDEHGRPLSPSHSVGRGGRYRYYVSRDTDDPQANAEPWRIRAEPLEEQVCAILCEHLKDRGRPDAPWSNAPETGDQYDALRAGPFAIRYELLRRHVTRVVLSTDRITLGLLNEQTNDPIEIHRAIKLKRRGVERKIVMQGLAGNTATPDPQLCDLLARSFKWMERLTSNAASSLSAIAQEENTSVADVSRTLQLAFLAPDIVEAILAGRQPVDLTAQKLKRLGTLPDQWPAQRKLLGFPHIS